jgi:thiamine biosynthesis protein ThiS
VACAIRGLEHFGPWSKEELLESIEVQLNGEKRVVPAGLTLRGLLEHMEIRADRVAVEYNREIVRPDRWDETIIQSGDELEVVHFVGGGR